MPELEPGAEEDEVGYRLDDWADDARGRMIVGLIDAGVAHRFEDDELVVDVADEAQVDELVSRLTEAPIEGGDVDEDDLDDSAVDDEDLDQPSGWGRPTAEVVQLEAAAGRLSLDPTDMEADGEVAEASTAVFVVDDPPWADVDTWAAVGRVTRRLMAALGAEDALEEEIRTQAGILARLLGPIVRPAASGAVVPGPPAEDVLATDTGSAAGTGSAADTGSAAGAGPAAGAGSTVDSGITADEGPATGDGPVADVGGIANGSDLATAGADSSATAPGATAADGDNDERDERGDDGQDRVGVGTGGSVAAGKRTETVYELGEWLPEQRAELAMLLDRVGIDHSWDTDNLVVASDREADVEAVLDRIEAVDDPDDDEEATYRALEELFAATDRLVGAPADVNRGKEVVRAVVVADGPTPVGLDDAQWWQIRQRARILADSIEHRAQTDVVLGEARTLRDLLRDLV